MAIVVELPRLSDTMEEGVVASWRVAVGDKVARGQVIAEIETDKATMEFESFEAGVVLRLVAEAGAALPVGAAIAVLGSAGEDAELALRAFADRRRAGGSAPVPDAPVPEAPAPAASGAAVPVAAVIAGARDATAPAVATVGPRPTGSEVPAGLDAAGDARVPASPYARKLAREAGIALHTITGSGPRGRVVKADVESAAVRPPVTTVAAAPRPGEVDEHGRPFQTRGDTLVPHSLMRKTIAKRMVQAKTEAPHFYLSIEVDMEEATRVRAAYQEANGVKVSVNDLVIMAVARSLLRHPDVNACYTPTGIVRRGDIHVGVAVAVEGGLVVPVLRFADQRSLVSIAQEVRALAAGARERTLTPEQMTGSSISVSNLGMFGIESFAAVINPGEGAILAVGAVEERVVVHEGAIVARKRMKCTMSCDHRAVDGAVGAVWLQTFRSYLESPMRMFT